MCKAEFAKQIPIEGKTATNVAFMQEKFDVVFSACTLKREMQHSKGFGEQELVRQYKDILPCLRAMKAANEGSEYFIRTAPDNNGHERFVSAGFVHGGTVQLCKDFGIHVYSLDAAFVPSTNKTRKILVLVGDTFSIFFFSCNFFWFLILRARRSH